MSLARYRFRLRYGLHYKAAGSLGGEGEAGLPNQLRRDILLQGGDNDHFYTEETNDKLGNGLEFFFEQMDSRYGAIS
jgi:hypothetical protein